MAGYTDTLWIRTLPYEDRLKTTLSLRIELARKIMADSTRRLTEIGLYSACDCVYTAAPSCECGAQAHFRKMWIDRYTGQQDAGQKDAGQQDADQPDPEQQYTNM
jgi:hypothetical protein